MYSNVLSRATLYEHAVNFLRTTDVIRVGLKLCKFTFRSNDFFPKVSRFDTRKKVNSDKFSFSPEIRCDLGLGTIAHGSVF